MAGLIVNKSKNAPSSEPKIYLGTSAFTAAGWQGTFYPPEIKSKDYLSYYAQHFDTVEVNSTLYGCPSPRTVENWAAKTPDNFIFSIKTPRSITHDKILANCDAELEEFLSIMEILGPKLGPILFQFPQFSPGVFADRHAFTDRLIPFLNKLPAGRKHAIEIRNPEWLDAEFANLLKQYQIALGLPDLPYMPRPEELVQKFDPITADWTYIRWLGDRKGIELQTLTWDKTVVDRTAELTSWVDFCYRIKRRGIIIYGYANNHYAGHGPATIQQFRDLWRKKGFPPLPEPVPTPRPPAPILVPPKKQPSLFD
ncbi:MAG: hypothetical protein QOG55_558 [Acidobacteriaceae bacterium]|jgi:uncharacterized protein YecE (DUF72 family)|nr:hypothetical protein [Acidobacteriaceae bacterium]